FDRFKVSKFKSRKAKKALTEIDMERIINFKRHQLPSAINARYVFLFSFFARGMNFTDIAELKWSDIDNLKFSYIRNKTNINIHVKLPENKTIEEILRYYRDRNPYDTDYVFPILKKDISQYSDDELLNRKKSVLKYYNKELNKLLQKLGINKHITFYSARHTFAMISLKKGIHISKIKQALGH